MSILGWGASAARAAAGVNIFVGYADNVRANPTNFPTPFGPGAGIIYDGCPTSCSFDGGTIRVVNNTSSSVTIDSVIVKLSTCVYDIWPHNTTLPAGSQLILAQFASGADNGCTPQNFHFDSSDIGAGGAPWSGNCSQSGVIPEVDVSVDGTSTAYNDTGQVLNTGGFDLGECPAGTNESTQWTLIGNNPCPSAVLTLTPPSQTHLINTNATITGTLTNAGGTGCGQPLQGATVNFTDLSGPNAGLTGTGTSPTDANGQATFTYSSSKTGTDTWQASVTNLAGTLTSNTVTVKWGTLQRAGNFTCRASAVRLTTALLSLEPTVANAPDNPCAKGSANLIGVNQPPTLTTGVLTATTGVSLGGPLPAAGDAAAASAYAARISTGVIPGHTISTGVLVSNSQVGCVSSGGGLAIQYASGSNVASLTIDGKTTTVGASPVTIPIDGIATVYANRTIKTGTSVTQRALEIDLLGQPVLVVAESIADVSGNPCGTAIM